MTIPAGPNIWQALAVTQAVAGGIVYIDSTGIPNIDILGLYFNPLTNSMSVNTAGDYTGTDSLNTYFQQDSYAPQSQVVNTADSSLTPGMTVSSSQGTGQVPLVNLTGDYLGQFAGWGYTGNTGTNAWRKLAAMHAYAIGTTAAAAGIGGELRWGTKQDNGVFTEWWKLTNLGAFSPLAAGTVDLGVLNFGVRKVYIDATVTGTVGAVTINKSAGRVIVAAGQSSVVVTNSLADAASLVFAQLATQDATATGVKSVVCAAGSFTINLAAAATGNTLVNFFLLPTDN